MGTTRDTPMKRNPACMAAHDFNHHDPTMAFCGGSEYFEEIADTVDCCIETEGIIGTIDIIVDGLWDTENIGARFIQRERDTERVIASRCDEGMNIEVIEIFFGDFKPILDLGDICA